MSSRSRLPGVIAVVLALSTEAVGATPARVDDPGERADVLLFGTAINRFIAGQLPWTVQLPGNRDAGIDSREVTVVEARYCGAMDAGRGRVIAVVRLPGAGPLPPVLKGAEDCQDKLEVLLRRSRAAADGGALAVAELIASWVPWQLRLSLGEWASSGDERPKGETGGDRLGAALASAKTKRSLATVDTAGLRLATKRDASITLDLAISFVTLKGGDAVAATLTSTGAGGAPPSPPSPVEPVVPGGADGVASATLSFANRMVALYSQDGPLVLDLQGQAVEIRNLQLLGGNHTLTLRGRATSRAFAESALIGIESAGPDLKVAEARADAEQEDCGVLSALASVRCRVRNGARATAAAGLAAGMTGRYRGQPLRSLIAPPPFSFEIDGRRIRLRLEPIRASSVGGVLLLYGRVDLS